MSQRNSQQFEVVPLPTQSSDAPRWCARVFYGVGALNHVAGFADQQRPFISVAVETEEEQAEAEAFVERLILKRMGRAPSRLATTMLRFPMD